MKFLKISKIKLQDTCYYLIQSHSWSPSGYAIAQYYNGDLVCESCGRTIPHAEITGITELTIDF